MVLPQEILQPEPTKRTQAERNAETRRKIIEATVACIDALGFANITMQKVARQAGVTVGAVQHHFASKSELLASVLEDGFRNVSFGLEHTLFVGKTLPECVSLFIDRCWIHHKTPALQANLHILLGMRTESPQVLDEWIQGPLREISAKGREYWLKVFGGINLSEAEHLELMVFVFSALSGIDSYTRIVGPQHQNEFADSNLKSLKDLLVLKLSTAKK